MISVGSLSYIKVGYWRTEMTILVLLGTKMFIRWLVVGMGFRVAERLPVSALRATNKQAISPDFRRSGTP